MNIVISLFLIIIVGIIASKFNIITAEINKGLISLLLKVTLPLLIISSFIDSEKYPLTHITNALFYGFIVFILTTIISYLFLFFIKSDKRKVLLFGNVFSNCGFMGFAVIKVIYGAEGVMFTSIFNMIFTLFLWTYGVILFSDKLSRHELKKLIYNPGLIAVYIGVIIMVFKINIHPILENSIHLIGDMTSPLSMLIVGYLLAKVNIKESIKHVSILYGTIIKLLVIPVSLYGLTFVIGIHSKVILTMIILEAMPAGAMTSIFAENFNKEKEYAVLFVFISTLLSIVTFPFISYLFHLKYI